MLDELVAEAGAAATPAGAGASATPASAGATEQTRVLTLAEVRGLLSERLAGRPTRANFRTGHMTVCTLYPMRSVPHRVVCLLGLDDGAFPRRTPRDGDDLMLVAPRVGERDPRSEDRQLLLDAVLAARDHLIVTYTGHDERTQPARARPRCRSASCSMSSTRPCAASTAGRGTRSNSIIRCSRLTRATSPAARSCPSSTGALTGWRSKAPER